ncbi:hypothetical protein BDN72DRAFT_495551 [Pluteus cervinus]|uniref:Uncharacterized protein n=1 Tax=Pluteus cervinus TaxID=181527 RepID=A0ACD3AYW3_9AGAR|nr:hypothetical protein BDN72DRAFT_495551 [Pluteus cervinus]
MPVEIVDVHRKDTNEVDDIRLSIMQGLTRPAGKKHLPTMLLYDERGLRLYDDITTEVPEYYLFGAEEEILKNHASDIVRAMHHGEDIPSPDEVVVELGAGALRKTSHILLGLSRLVSEPTTPAPITYYALDLEERELKRSLDQITASELGMSLSGKVETKGMWGTYDGGLKFIESGGLQSLMVSSQLNATAGETFDVDQDHLDSPLSSSDASLSGDNHSASSNSEAVSSMPTTPDGTQPPLHIMFLGSSIGNFNREDSAKFLRSLPLRPGSRDTLLLGMDHDNGKDLIEVAYNDPQGYTCKFILNGLKTAGRALGDESLFDEDKWEYVNRYNPETRQHEAFFRSRATHAVQDPKTQQEISFEVGELLKIEESFKYSEIDAYTLFSDSNLRPIQRWTDSTGRYSLWLLERPAFTFPLLSSPLACNKQGVLVPKQPISSTLFGVPSLQEWENLWALWDCITMQMIPPTMMFQKPIDLRHICLFYLGHIPTFLDIHLSRLLGQPHTEPVAFKDIFERGIDPNVDDPSQCHPHSEVPLEDEDWPKLPSILQFKHRVRERLSRLYADILSGATPLSNKIGRVLFMTYEHEAMHAETLLYMLLQRAGTGTLPPLGFSLPPWETLAASWDALPKPSEPTVTLGPAEVFIGHDDDEEKDQSVTDTARYEFGWDNENPKSKSRVGEFRIEWRPVTNGEFYEFYVANEGKDERVQLPASWVEQEGEMRVRTIYGPIPMKIAQDWPIMTSYNNLSVYAMVKGGRLPTEPELRLFYDKFESGFEGGSNWGFRNWHPIPATTGGERSGGKGGNGGVWEWTSTRFEKREGFVPSKLYPGYSADFFDDHHQVVIGGSFATVPRISERRSFRNWYQRNYPFAWVGGRVAYDVVRE